MASPVRPLRRLAKFTGVGLLLSCDQAEQGCLSCTVRADDAHDTAGWQCESDVFIEQPVAIGFGDTFCLHHHRTETLGDGDHDLRRSPPRILRFQQHFLIGLDARLGFRLAGLGRLGDPLALAGQSALARFSRTLSALVRSGVPILE